MGFPLSLSSLESGTEQNITIGSGNYSFESVSIKLSAITETWDLCVQTDNSDTGFYFGEYSVTSDNAGVLTGGGNVASTLTLQIPASSGTTDNYHTRVRVGATCNGDDTNSYKARFPDFSISANPTLELYKTDVDVSNPAYTGVDVCMTLIDQAANDEIIEFDITGGTNENILIPITGTLPYAIDYSVMSSMCDGSGATVSGANLTLNAGSLVVP